MLRGDTGTNQEARLSVQEDQERIEMDPIDNLMPEIPQKTHAPSDQERGRGKKKSTGEAGSRFRGAGGEFSGPPPRERWTGHK